jgi:hypothetical protein
MTAFFDPPEVHRPCGYNHTTAFISRLVDPRLSVECEAIAAKAAEA